MALWHSSLLDGHALHRDRVRALGRYLQNRLAVGTDDAFYWPYWLPEFPVQGTIDRLEVQGEDLSHASLTAQLALTLGAANEVFAREDLARLSRTVTRGFARLGDGVLLVEPGGQATKAFPAWRLHQDWIYQDHGLEDGACFTDTHTADRERQMVERVLAELDGDDPGTSALRARLSDLTRAEVAGADARWRELYVRACQRRRQARLATLRSHAEKIVFTKQDVHAGQAMAGVPRGTVKNLRVVAIEYRAADAYYNSNVGEAGVSHSRTPPAINNGSWDVKHVLGTVPVESDGSAYFEVPARTPVYFQLLDERGYVVQTMRSWSTLQPGETQTCVGCHESKHDTPPAAPGQALRAGVRKLTPFDRFAAQHGARNPITDPTLSGPAAVQALLTVNNPGGFGEAGGFRYVREIQPILDQHCVRCHTGATTTDGDARQMNLTGEVLSYTYTQCPNNGDSTQDARRAFTASYLNLTRFGHGDGPVNWISAQSRPTLLPPYFAGAATSPLMQYLEPSHHGVQLSRLEKERVACWIDLGVPFCGSYTDANHWEPEVKATYAYFEAKRGRWAEIEVDNLRKLLAARAHGARFSLEDFQVFDLGGPAARRQFEQTWLETHARAPAAHASQPAE